MGSSFYTVLGIVAWIAVALWPAMVAKNKGYSFILFYLLSIPLFFVTLILAYTMKDKTMTAEDRADDRAAEKALDKEEGAN